MSSCANCLKVILENGVSYSINPDSVCKCEKPMPIHSTATVVTAPNTQPSTPLSEVYKQIVKEKNPDNFIDLLCANHFFAGHFGNIIPVNEARIAFEKWLTRHNEAQRQSDLKKLSFHFAIPVEDLEKALQSKERV